MRLETRSIITDGRTTEFAREFLTKALSRFEGHEVTISIETFYPLISSRQNRFLHGVFLLALWTMRREGGENITQEKSREDFKKIFGPHEMLKDEKGRPQSTEDGFILYGPKSVSKWNTKETEDAMEQCRAEYAPFGELPLPNDDYLNQPQQGA